MRKQIKLLALGLFVLLQFEQAQSQYSPSELMNMKTTGIKPPSAPNYASCTAQGVTDAGCINALQANYQKNLNTYNQVKQQEIAAAQKEAENRAKYESQKAAAEEAQRQNQRAQKKYERSQMLTQLASLAFAGAAAACGVAGCQFPLMAASMVMSGFSNQAGTQANTHYGSKYEACNFANQVSTNTADCGSAPTDFKPENYPFNVTNNPDTIINNDGKCTGAADICKDIIDNLPPGTSLKDYKKGISAFAGTNAKKPFKVNPDGSITAATGKTYTAADFASTEAMIASGITPATAKMISDMMKKNEAFSAKSELANFDSSGFGELDSAAAAAATAAANGIGNGTLGATLESAVDGKDKFARSIASAEGLAKDFNGELIGVSGDDIFKMMNRRYQLKENQDSFLKFKP